MKTHATIVKGLLSFVFSGVATACHSAPFEEARTVKIKMQDHLGGKA